jgi:hypothetical protein
VKDANFDMDIDPNFDEAINIFYEKLGHFNKEETTFLKRQLPEDHDNDYMSEEDDEDKLIDNLE